MNTIKELIDYISKLLQWWVIITPWEQGVRVRFGKNPKVLNEGIYFKIPFFDSVYVQTIRLRVSNLPLQTVSTKDDKTITLTLALGYSIIDIRKLFTTLSHPESTLSNICTGEISEYVSTHNFEECKPLMLEQAVRLKIDSFDQYGIKVEYFKVIGFVNVRTYRLINDMYANTNPMDMETKR